MKIHQEHFQSIHQLLKTLDGRSNNAVMRNAYSSKNGSEEFTLTKSWDHAMYLLKHGYTDILDDIKAGMRKHAKFQNPAKRRTAVTAVQGVVPHVPNAILGVPNAMIHYETEIRKTKAISLVYIQTAPAREYAETFVKAGIALLSTIHSLEIRGYRVKLKVAIFCSERDFEQAFATVKVKDYREHLDLHKLCFPIAHPSTLRRIGFKWLETIPGLQDPGWSIGYGKPIRDNRIKEMENVLEKNEQFLTLLTIKELNFNVDKIIEHLNLN